MTSLDAPIERSTFPFISEEVATILFLTHGPGTVAINGVEACDGIDAPGFDVGLRSLLAKDLVRVESDTVALASACEDIAACITEPDPVALLIITTDHVHDALSIGCSSGMTTVVRGMAAGAFQIALWKSGLVEVALNIADQLRDDVEDTEWSAGVRLQVIGSPPVDFVVGPGRIGLVVDDRPEEATAAAVRELLEQAVSVG